MITPEQREFLNDLRRVVEAYTKTSIDPKIKRLKEVVYAKYLFVRLYDRIYISPDENVPSKVSDMSLEEYLLGSRRIGIVDYYRNRYAPIKRNWEDDVRMMLPMLQASAKKRMPVAVVMDLIKTDQLDLDTFIEAYIEAANLVGDEIIKFGDYVKRECIFIANK